MTHLFGYRDSDFTPIAFASVTSALNSSSLRRPPGIDAVLDTPMRFDYLLKAVIIIVDVVSVDVHSEA